MKNAKFIIRVMVVWIVVGPWTSELANGTTTYLWWTDAHTGNMQRANLDGSNVETLISSGGVHYRNGIAVDPHGGKVY